MIHLLLIIALSIGSINADPVTLLARIGKTISHVQIDPVTLHLSHSRILYKSIGEELQVSLTVDEKSQSGFFTLGQQLYRVPLNGTTEGSSQLTIGGVLDDTPTSIAYDWLTNKIYVAISTIGPDNSARIEVCDDVSGEKTDGNCAVILHDRLDYLHSLVLDPLDGNMYWINAVQNQIERAFMNGQHHDPHPFLNPASTEGATLTSLALSREAASIFYVRTTKDRSQLWQCRLYERQSCTQLFETSHVLHLAVHDKYLFISLNNGQLAICEYALCEATIHLVEQISELEIFDIVENMADTEENRASNPCGTNNGGCSHICLVARIAPKRTCACPIGIRLKSDGTTCEEDFKEVLLISAITGLYYISLDTPDYTPQAIPYEGHDESSHSLFDVDFDPVEGFVYWLDITDTSINRCRFNGSDLSVVIKEGIQQSTKTFRLDVVGRNIFWVDGETGLIWIGKMDGSLSPRILDASTKLDNPHGITIDGNGGVIYITDWTERSTRIVKMNLDGSNAETFYALQDFAYPTGIELDIEGGRLYWAESNHSLIRSIKLDATDLLSYMQSSYKLIQPYSVAKLGNRIFCNSMAGRSFVEIVLRDGILAGHDSSRVVESQIYGPVGLRAVKLNEPAKREGACAKDNGGCSHYCLNCPSRERRCLCARDYELLHDGKTCIKSTSHVVILDGGNRRTDLTRMSIKGPRNLERLHLQGLSGTPHDIAYDQISSMIYITSGNDSSGTIERVNITSPTPKANVVASGVALKGISHLAIEPHAKLLIYSNSEFGRISACSLEGKHEKTLAWSKIRPTLIDLDLTRSQIYYVNESIEQSTISKMPMAVTPGGGQIVYTTKSTILALAADSRGEEIYWTELNQGASTIHRMHISGRGPAVLSRSDDRRISYLKVHDSVLYYIDSKKNEFGYFNGSGYHSVHAGVKSVRDFVIVHPPASTEGNHPCENNNGGCTEICLPSRSKVKDQAVCSCGDHRYHDPVSKSCTVNSLGIILAGNGRLLMISARDAKAMLNEDHSPLTVLPVEKVGLPLSVAVDELSRFATLYWVDANEPKYIRSVSTRTSMMQNPQSLHVVACAHLRALAVDTYGRQLFVSCVASSGRSHVMVFRIQSSISMVPDKLLHIGRVVNGEEVSPVTGKRPVPTELAVGARKLVYLDVSTRSGRPVLVVCDLDGRNCNKASERTEGYSRLALLPRQGKLLFTGDDVINQLDLSTLNTSPMPSDDDELKTLFAPIDAQNVVTIPIDEKEDSFLHIGDESIRIPGMTRISAMTSFATSEVEQLDRSRSCMHQECTHLCSYVGDGYECLCPLGYTISRDSSYICMPNVTCEPWEFLCKDQRTCVHSGSKCDSRLNCPDGSDESSEVCAHLDSTLFMCADGLTRLDRYLVCDGQAQCPDRSDEVGCRCMMPQSEMDCALFGRMSQPECVQRRLRCDHHYDCSNGADEDERMCTAFTPEAAEFRLTLTQFMYGAIVFLILLAVCPILFYFCYTKKHMRMPDEVQTVSDRRYYPSIHSDPTVMVPLSSARHDQYEMGVRAYSVVESTSTYPSLPPPIQSMCGSTRSGLMDPYYGHQPGRDHPSRFYAPPPSTASLSTYGIVVAPNAGTLSQRRIVITEQHAMPSPSSRNGLSPPPAYLVRKQQRELQAPPARKKTSRASGSNSNLKQTTRSRATLNRSHSSSAESEHDSVSLSSHSSEGAPTSSRQQL